MLILTESSKNSKIAELQTFGETRPETSFICSGDNSNGDAASCGGSGGTYVLN